MEKLENIVVTNIDEVFSVYSPKGKTASVTNRFGYGLSFCQEGKIVYHHKGKDYVSDASCVILLPKGEDYSLTVEQTGVFPVVNFQCAEPLTDVHRLIPVRDTESLMQDYKRLRSLSLFENNRTEMLSVFYRMISGILRQQKMDDGILHPAAEHIKKQYGNSDLSNAELADLCGISEVYFRKLFEKRYGMTPKQYIIDIRMSRAKQLLAEGGMKICAVAEACGFSGPYHFSRMFKQKVGMTPTEYMEKNRVYRI